VSAPTVPQLNYERRGSGPPLVLLHGIGHRLQAWDPCRAELVVVSTPKSLRGGDTTHLDRVVVGTVPLVDAVPYRGAGWTSRSAYSRSLMVLINALNSAEEGESA